MGGSRASTGNSVRHLGIERVHALTEGAAVTKGAEFRARLQPAWVVALTIAAVADVNVRWALPGLTSFVHVCGSAPLVRMHVAVEHKRHGVSVRARVSERFWRCVLCFGGCRRTSSTARSNGKIE